MEIKYDKKSDSKYIKVKQGEIGYTQEIVEGWLFFDFSKEGEILGIEVLDASKHGFLNRNWYN